MVPLLLKCGCLPLSLRLLVGRVFPLVLLPSPVLFIKKKTRACVAKKILLFGQHLFFNITDFSCAKKRVRHAYICPTTVIGQPVLKFYPPPPQIVSAAAKTFKIPGGKLRFFRSKISGQNGVYFLDVFF